MMSRILAALLGLSVCAAPVAAQEYLGQYFTTIGPEDMHNSSGQRLWNFCAIVQQDRANYHRFGIRHPHDEGDPFFGTYEMRSNIPGSCRIMPGSEYVADRVLSGTTKYIRVEVYGIDGIPTGVMVSEGAG